MRLRRLLSLDAAWRSVISCWILLILGVVFYRNGPQGPIDPGSLTCNIDVQMMINEQTAVFCFVGGLIICALSPWTSDKEEA